MVVLDRNENKIERVAFIDIYNYLRSGDLLVLNDSYVLANILLFSMGMQCLQVIMYGQ